MHAPKKTVLRLSHKVLLGLEQLDHSLLNTSNPKDDSEKN